MGSGNLAASPASGSQQTLLQINGEPPNDEADLCVICLSQISGPATAVPCLHTNFDFSCLISWLSQRPTCPLCKVLVTGVEYIADACGKKELYIVPAKSEVKTESTVFHPERHPPAPQRTYLRSTHPRPRNSSIPYIPVAARSSPEAAIARRRYIYAHGLYSLHVGSNRMSQYTNLTPNLFARSDLLITRAKTWIRRELQVFTFLSSTSPSQQDASSSEMTTNAASGRSLASNAEFLLEYIIAILKTVDIGGHAGQAADMVSEFLGRENTSLFLHELKAWLRSPYERVEDWDRWVQYDEDGVTPGRTKCASRSRPRERGRTEWRKREPYLKSRRVPKEGARRRCTPD